MIIVEYFEQDIIKITRIRLENYKNVSYGVMDISDLKESEEGKGSITGIYGQNGSGKTSVISAISLVKSLFEGESLPEDVGEYIESGKSRALIEVEMYLGKKEHDEGYLVRYVCIIAKDETSAFIEEESVKYRCISKKEGAKGREFSLVSSRYDKNDLSPKYRHSEVARLYKSKVDLLVGKKMSHERNRSFIFSNELIALLDEKREMVPEEFCILERLRFFAKTCLFIIDNKKIALSDANVMLPIAFKQYKDGKTSVFGQIPIALNKPSELEVSAMKQTQGILEASNKVLKEIIPGLSIEIVELGRKMSETGKEMVMFEMMSCRGEVKIPIRYESDGIKKIVAVLHMLIALYNSETITVLIDELDAGIFEYLLGEILQIVEEKSKGQLIFTSHNLRPLEILDKNNLIFTTVNPNNRYIKLKNGRPNNNLRDTYYRDILLGGQSEEIYLTTNSAKISRAFRKAGEKEL